jgi:hypothetical protein
MMMLETAKNAFGGMATGPRSLAGALKYASDGDPNVEAAFRDHVRDCIPSDPVFELISKTLSFWDYESSTKWADDTKKNTAERRQRIYLLLEVDQEMQSRLDDRFPPNLDFDAPIVIATKHRPWYDAARQSRQSFYRDAYAEYLRTHRGWNETQIGDLEESTRVVAERLSDPEDNDIYPVRGLVVGFVQSGKTANFTGVIARAADAGYRLIIVLAGTLNILRAQTQRRIDRELIGKPFINADNEETYAADLMNFVDHGGMPSEHGGFDWHRLTNIDGDYKRLKQGIQSLEFRRRDKTKLFNHPDNLHFEDVRLLVVKKVPSVLKKVAADLNAIKSRLADIPTLVIDDESDQASVNTKKPTATEIKERTATNSAIVSLLQQLPRAQYVGYTATPFANVFVDPNLAEDLFPRDFIISLPRPKNYMGVADFHDLERADKSIPGANEIAFVRNVIGADTAPENLQQALDSYILTGAIKLFRQAVKPELKKYYRHHTMLVHSSHLTGEHSVMAAQVESVLSNGGYMSGTAWPRLRSLWEKDFQVISAQRADGYPVAASFEDIEPFLGECWKRLKNGPKPVLTVNGDAKDNPDFESDGIWKIVVGGAKLSRGYTIEGLTVSYYRRRAGAADALMQMGRWFGFRDAYRDLVRLYIGREESTGLKRTIDLYAAFEAVCRDEMEFRSELRKYAYPADGVPILPKQVPPLVPSHLLQPTSKNKMYNAFIQFKNFSEQWKEHTLAPSVDSEIEKNEKLLEKLLEAGLSKGSLSISFREVATNKKVLNSFDAKWATRTPAQMLAFLEHYRWLGNDKGVLEREIEFLKSSQKTMVDRWLFLYIEGPKESKPYVSAGQEFRPFNRSRVGTADRFNVYSESKHRPLAQYLAGASNERVTDLEAGNAQTAELKSLSQGIFVFYPTRDEKDPSARVTPGFALQYPKNHIQTPIRFGVHVKDRPDAVVVDE